MTPVATFTRDLDRLTRPIDFVARASHYIDHLAPIYLALPEAYRGRFFTRVGLVAHAGLRGIAAAQSYGPRANLVRLLRQQRGPVMVTGYRDLRIANRSGRPQIYNDHGAGFTFANGHPSYIGARRGRRRVVLSLTASGRGADVERRAHPRTPAVAIGCPRLDPWHQRVREGWVKPRAGAPVVAISFHFNARRIPETRWALPHFRSALPRLAREFTLIGHGHPRAQRRLRRIYARDGIEFVPDFNEVLERADVYVCDASSTTYEFASMDRPVVLMNAPWYRRDRHFPGNPRFWEFADVGLQCGEAGALVDTVHQALIDPLAQRAARRRAVDAVYAVSDGTAARRAADAILSRVAP